MYKNDKKTMTINQIIASVTQICQDLNIPRVDLFGSFATGTATERSDIDFVVYGKIDHDALESAAEEIETLRKIDFFYYDEIENKYLQEDIKKYGVQIY